MEFYKDIDLECYFVPLLCDKAHEPQLPTRATKGSAGYDFFMPHDVTIPAHGYSELIKTNVAAHMPKNAVLLLAIRSSLAMKRHLLLANGVGVIDSDYFNNLDNLGNIGAVLYNNSGEDVKLKAGERFMQGIFVSFLTTHDDAVQTQRTGGYGSTGKR